MKRRAFTLIEMIIYLALVGLVLTAFIYFVLAVAAAKNKAVAASQVADSSRYATWTISRLIRSARSFDQTTSLFNETRGRLVLQQVSGVGALVILDLSNDNRLRLTVDGQTSFLSGELVNFSRLRFSDYGRGNLGWELTVNYGRGVPAASIDSQFSQTLATTATLAQ